LIPSGLTSLRTVANTEVDWYWFPRIPLGSITLLFGMAGIGKSTMMYDVLAKASIGAAMPLSAVRPDKNHDVAMSRSIIVGTEDAPARVAQVLERAGADLDNIAVVPQDKLPHPELGPLEQLGFIEEQMIAFNCRVLYVDNVTEAMLGNTDSNNERSVRMALRPLDALAKRRNAAVVMTSHPKKGGEGGDIKEAMTGSQAFTNLARSTLYVARVPNTQVNGLAVAKSNYYPADLVNTISYRLVSEAIGERDGHAVLDIPSVEWGHVIPYTAQELALANWKAREEKKESGNAVRVPSEQP